MFDNVSRAGYARSVLLLCPFYECHRGIELIGGPLRFMPGWGRESGFERET